MEFVSHEIQGAYEPWFVISWQGIGEENLQQHVEIQQFKTNEVYNIDIDHFQTHSISQTITELVTTRGNPSNKENSASLNASINSPKNAPLNAHTGA